MFQTFRLPSFSSSEWVRNCCEPWCCAAPWSTCTPSPCPAAPGSTAPPAWTLPGLPGLQPTSFSALTAGDSVQHLSCTVALLSVWCGMVPEGFRSLLCRPAAFLSLCWHQGRPVSSVCLILIRAWGCGISQTPTRGQQGVRGATSRNFLDLLTGVGWGIYRVAKSIVAAISGKIL